MLNTNHFNLSADLTHQYDFQVRDYKKPTEPCLTGDEDEVSPKAKLKEEPVTDTNWKAEPVKEEAELGGLLKEEHTDIPEPVLPSPPPPAEKPVEEDTQSFQMKIFASYSEGPGGGQEEPMFAKVNGKVTKDSSQQPDILRNGKHGAVAVAPPTVPVAPTTIPVAPRTIPVVPPTVPNHLESGRQRATENPYAKPGDLKPAAEPGKKTSSDRQDMRHSDHPMGELKHGTKRKSGSADDLLDAKSSSRNNKEVTFKDPPTSTHPRVKIRDPKPRGGEHHKHCNNPVCLKDHVPPEPAPPPARSAPPTSPQAPPPRSQSLNNVDQEIDVDHMVDPGYQIVEGYNSSPGGYHGGGGGGDWFRTLPSRPRRGSRDSRDYHDSPDSRSPYHYQTLPGRHRAASPRYPGSPKAASSPEDNITYGPIHEGRHEGRSKGRTEGRGFQGMAATLDELLSPPFANLAATTGSKSAKKKTPKPGEKDEFGTAV